VNWPDMIYCLLIGVVLFYELQVWLTSSTSLP